MSDLDELGPVEVELYRAALARPGAAVADLVDQLEHSPDDVHKPIRRLTEMGLIRVDDGDRVTAVSPMLAEATVPGAEDLELGARRASVEARRNAIRADRLRMPDEIGLGFMIDPDKGHFNGRRAILEARAKKKLRHVLVGLEIEGNIPAEHAIVYYRKSREVGLVSAAMWSPMAKRNIALASLRRPYGDTIVDDLWVEIYAMRELKYERLMKRARVVQRPFMKLDRRTASPPRDF